ncbi:FAD-dependent monooxygenase [Agromyces tardus]|nr:FAD-dependent monooxygenase [Agromyces tardus]
MKVLVSGAGIAGLALAHVLADGGHDVVVVEIAPALRSGGQLVDLRGTSREAAARMGLLSRIEEAQLAQRGMRYVDDDNRTLAVIGVELFGGNGPVADLEIVRGELTRVLFDATAGRVEHRFDDSIVALEQDDDGVDVRFDRAAPERFDLVVAADGVHSRVRRLLWGEEAQFARPLGGRMSFFTVPEPEPLDGWSLLDVLPGRRMAMIRPHEESGSAHAILTWFGTDASPDRGDVAAQQRAVRAAFADAGWYLPEVLAGLDASPDFYFDDLVQLHVPQLARGRVVLLGDAGYCPSPLSGQGTALALIGAHVLGSELARHAHPREALAAYETAMTPHIEAGRKLPPGSGSFATPKSRLARRVLQSYVRASMRRPLLTLFERAMSSQHDVPLPEYEPVAV